MPWTCGICLICDGIHRRSSDPCVFLDIAMLYTTDYWLRSQQSTVWCKRNHCCLHIARVFATCYILYTNWFDVTDKSIIGHDLNTHPIFVRMNVHYTLLYMVLIKCNYKYVTFIHAVHAVSDQYINKYTHFDYKQAAENSQL